EAKETLKRLKKATGEEAEGDVTLRFMDAGLYVELEKLVGTMRKLVALKEELRDECMPVDVLLEYPRVSLGGCYLGREIAKMLDDRIEACRSVRDSNESYARVEAEKREFVKGDEIDCVNKTVGKVEEAMEMLRKVVIRYFVELDKVIGEIGMLDRSYLYGKVCDYVTDYARRERKQEEKRLKMQAQKMKRERYEVLSDKHWGEVLESEERVMKLAGEGKMESAAEESYDECDREMCRAMEGNRELIGEMMRIWADDELFDMEQLLSENCCIMGLLTVDNIGLFARLVLRGNIIRSKMNEELRRKFEAWIGDEEKEGKENDEKRNVNEGKRGDEEGKGVLMSRSAMKEWRKLQEKGWIDENLQPTTNMQMAAVIASVLGEKLKLKPKWAAFESLWEMKGLATRLTRALSGGSGKRYCDFQKEVEKALGMSHKRD
ncbi:MAG: hypothetical protein MJ001_08470, partial [Paludibacteraceae bacterium]|nr:hypothetical protein [Paludibacteraceae bacterium]